MRAIVVKEPGVRDVLRLEDVETPEPGPGKVLIEVAVADVNFADVGMRRPARESVAPHSRRHRGGAGLLAPSPVVRAKRRAQGTEAPVTCALTLSCASLAVWL